jgi:hypothetical protein
VRGIFSLIYAGLLLGGIPIVLFGIFECLKRVLSGGVTTEVIFEGRSFYPRSNGFLRLYADPAIFAKAFLSFI